MNKLGITGVSLVIYCILFFVFTIFITTTTSNFNSQMFLKKGETINMTQYSKLLYSMRDSEVNSENVFIIGETIVYSNGDVYEFDETKNVVLKNDETLATNVKTFETRSQLLDKSNKITITITFNKYLQETEREIVICAGR